MEIKETTILKTNVNVLLITPAFSKTGGVSEFNKLLLRYCRRSNIITFSMRSGMSKNIGGKFVAIVIDYVRYLYILLTKNLDVVHVGPSLNRKSLQRDSVYVFLAKLFNKSVFVHWHGWNPDFEYLLNQEKFLKHTLFRANHIKFLSSYFEGKMINAGFKNMTTLGNTLVDDNLLEAVVRKRDGRDRNFNILFLSTVSINKGIYIMLDAFRIVREKMENTRLTIAGDGPELERARQYVRENGIEKVDFTHHVENTRKAEVFVNADLYVFPSQYEGMPTSVLEAMAFGLPILCNRVGALADFFENGRMGIALDNGTSKDFAYHIINFANNHKLCDNVGKFNQKYARGRFLASKGVEKIEEEYYMLAHQPDFPERILRQRRKS